MAMAFTPLAIRVPIIVEEAEVVSKSYPDFWIDLKKMDLKWKKFKKSQDDWIRTNDPSTQYFSTLPELHFVPNFEQK